MVVFISFREFESKSGKDCKVLKLCSVLDSEKVFEKDFFLWEPSEAVLEVARQLIFGDVVEIEVASNDGFSNSVNIVSLRKKAPSPYFEKSK